jgi:hypothetical protein
MGDEQYEALMCPQPTIVALSLANNPDYTKCPRCWHYTHEGLHNHDGLCDRCCSVLLDVWPDHEATQAIKLRRTHDTRRYEGAT